MPTYEYQCSNCGHHFDLMQKINDAPASQCPQCLNDTAVRLISAAGFQLKGDGWYVTDFKNRAPTAKDTAKESNATNDKTQTAVESKPATTESKD